MGVELTDMINSIVSESIWGVVNHKELEMKQLRDWSMYSNIPSSAPPAIQTDDMVITFGEFLENVLKSPRNERKQLKNAFTNPGAIGEQCRESYELLMNAMQIPSHLREHCISYPFFSNEFTKSSTTTTTKNISSPATYHIIPSFFHLIKFLDSKNVDFRIIFRTFGNDIHAVTEEYNVFCDGNHPLFPLTSEECMNGYGKNGINRKISRTDFYMMKRTSNEKSGQQLYSSSGEDSPIILDQTDVRQPITGATEIYQYIRHLFDEKQVFSMAIKDDFSWWHSYKESDDSGKLLLVDSTETTAGRSEVQIFFDDNIERDRAHIIDVRDAATFEAVPFTHSNKRWIRRVEPYYSITDKEYYIKEVLDVLALIHMSV